MARTVKPSKDLNKPRVIELFEIEREYWNNRGVDWAIVTEKEISEVTKALEGAIDGLIIANAENNNSNNGESNNDSNNNNGGNANNGNSNSNNSGKGNSNLPKTGGTSSVAVSLFGLLTVGIGSFLRRKNK